MRLLSIIYRVVYNFAFLALVFFSLNAIERYNSRAILAIMFLVYAGMRGVSVLRSFHFFSLIERLEIDALRLIGLLEQGLSGPATRKLVVAEVGQLRRVGEIKSYIDLFFLAAIVLLCFAKIVTG